MNRSIPDSASSVGMRKYSAGRQLFFLCLFACFSGTLLLFNSCSKKEIAPRKVKSIGGRVKWEFKSFGSGVSHPALSSDGTIYVGSNRGLQAVAPDGKLVWETTLSGASTPVVADDDAIYLGTHSGFMFGVGNSGQLVWQPGYGLSGFGAPPALGPDTTLYFLNSAADIFAFQPKRSNEKLWSLETFREGNLQASFVLPGTAKSDGILRSSAPLLTSNGSLILPRQNFLHSISTDGSPEWELELTAGNLGQAAVASDGTIYIGDDRNVVFAVTSTGSKKWELDAAGSVIGSPVIDNNGIIYFNDGQAVFAMTPDGHVKWRFVPPQKMNLLTSPVLAADGTIYVGGEFSLLAIHPDGSPKWSLRLYSPTSSPNIGPDGTIYFGCGYSWLCAVEDSGSPLMQSSWPKQFHDSANTSNIMHKGN